MDDKTQMLLRHESRRMRFLARGVIVTTVLFIVSFFIAGLLQGPSYSSAYHDLSDLGALTAQYPWFMRLSQLAMGMFVIAFSLGALRPALQVAGHREPISAWLVALSLLGLDNVTDPFSPLACMAANPGCTTEMAAATTAGTMHYVFGYTTAFISATAPFALTRRMRLSSDWSDMASWATKFGVMIIGLLVIYSLMEGTLGVGYVQRILVIFLALGLVALARRVETIAQAEL